MEKTPDIEASPATLAKWPGHLGSEACHCLLSNPQNLAVSRRLIDGCHGSRKLLGADANALDLCDLLVATTTWGVG
jgi:hypothetical protein